MYAKKKCKWKFILITYEIMNMIWSEQIMVQDCTKN
jgi:hypothetical protein